MSNIRKRGFTLIELLLYIGILVAVVLMVSVFSSTVIRSRIKNQTIADVEQQGSQMMYLITQTIRNAQSINSPAQGVSASSLSLVVDDILKSPTVFDFSLGVVQIKEGVGSPVPLTSSKLEASNLNFQNLSTSDTALNIRIQFTLTYRNSSGRNEYNYSQTFYDSASLRK